MCKERLGPILDTKYLANNLHSLWTDGNPLTELEKLYRSLASSQPTPNIVVNPRYGYSLDDTEKSASHEAGFDALMTGAVCSKALSKVGLLKGFLKLEKTNEIQTSLLKSVIGKLPLGGLKVPFCLDGPQIPYSDSSSLNFHCRATGKGVHFSTLEKVLQETIGTVRIYLVYGTTPECFFSFKNEAAAKQFSEKLEELGGAMASTLLFISQIIK